MPVIRGYVNGTSAGVGPRVVSMHERAKRDVVKGWTPGAVRRHTRWLYSVDAPALDQAGEVGVAVTLTLRDTPPDAVEWQRLRRSWQEGMQHAGAARVHWVVEWQRRGVPHLHTALYFDRDRMPAGTSSRAEALQQAGALAVFGWVTRAEEYGARPNAQHFDGIDGPLGWLQYLSKHAARGVRHYQRQGHPAGWDRSGRLWGHAGSWPLIEEQAWTVGMPTFHRYRRLVRAWRIADARQALDDARTADQARQARARIRFARRMLACPDRRLGTVRGVSDWVPEAVQLRLLAQLEHEGHELVPREAVQ